VHVAKASSSACVQRVQSAVSVCTTGNSVGHDQDSERGTTNGALSRRFLPEVFELKLAPCHHRRDWVRDVGSAAMNARRRAKIFIASEQFLGQRDYYARRASYVAESVYVLVLSDLADEFGADGAQAGDSVVDAFDGKHDAPEA
jgi:hypothetical protein